MKRNIDIVMEKTHIERSFYEHEIDSKKRAEI